MILMIINVTVAFGVMTNKLLINNLQLINPLYAGFFMSVGYIKLQMVTKIYLYHIDY